MFDFGAQHGSLFGALGVIALVAIGIFAIGRQIFNRVRRNGSPQSSRQADLDAQQLSELLRLSGHFVWRTDEQHRLTRISGAEWIPFLGRTSDWLNRPFRDVGWTVLPEDGWGKIEATLDQRLPVHVTLRCDNHESGNDGNEAGEIHFLELSGQALMRAGQFDGYIGIGRDITAHVSAEHELQESQARYQEVIDSVREVVFRTDERMCFTFLNRAWEVYTDLPIAECIGRSLLDFVHPDDRDATAQQMQRVLEREIDEYHGQLRLPSRHGEIRWIEATARLVRNGARTLQPGSLAGTFDDISARKVAEMTLKNVNQELESRVKMRTSELEASNRELEAFSYSVSHDLRAPLRSIHGFARILEEDLGSQLNPSSRDHLERIRNAAGRMAYLIDSLLELARLSRHTVRKETVNLSDLALQIFEELRAEDPSRKVEVEITSDLTVTADKTLMRVVLENLIRNAWKFSARSKNARISFHADRSDDKRVFYVSDNGVGFDMAFATHLFRAFHRLHDNAEFSGSGIGLANVQRIIHRHGGQIWARSAPGHGASFYFTLDA